MSYPDAHYDEDNDCPCPDHVAMREEQERQDLENESPVARLLRRVLGSGS
jgi:hypothetical protein